MSSEVSGQQQGQNNGSGPQSGDMGGGQQQQQSQQGGNQQGHNQSVTQHQQPQQQQLQLQQTTAGGQNNQGANQMQQLQVIQQPLQNQYLQHLYNPQGQQLIMPSNFALNHQLNSQIQVITAGKTFQQNQLGNPHMLTSGYTTIPTSAANNQAYIIGQLINQGGQTIMQQHSQQTSKPGDMQKVIQPQITQTQLPQGLTWAAAPQFLTQNPIFIRGTQQDQMFIQQQQPLHGNAGSHQQFTMPLTSTGQLPTSISSTTNGLQVQQQQQNQVQGNQTNQAQQQNQSQNQAIQPANVMSMKTPATLQPKPPLQIQPSPSNQQQQAQQQQHQQHQQIHQQQIQQIQMSGQQLQMIPQPTSQANVLPQQILTQAQQTITTQVMHPNQSQQQQMHQQRQLTILPQQTGQSLQPHQLTFIQQPQHQPIRPNYTVTAATSSQQVTSQVQGVTTTPIPQQRPKIRKATPGRGAANNSSPGQQGKVMYPRPNMSTNVNTPIQSKGQTNQVPTGATLTRVSVANSMNQNQSHLQSVQQPLKTINISALHTPPTLPDATLTPLIPQSNVQQILSSSVQSSQPIQLFTTTQQLPTPNISITPAPPPKKDEPVAELHVESKADTEKENTKMSNSSHSHDDVEDNKSKLPKAMVKPQVLTHVIEGFVIQEASEPFPMTRNGDSDEPPKKKVALSGEMGKCEMCGKFDLKSKFKKNKRFCSSACAKGMKAHQHQQQHQNQGNTNTLTVNPTDNHKKAKSKKWGEGGDADLTDETSSSMGETSVMSPAIEHVEEESKMNPVKWNVAEVVDFVRTLPGCSEYADDFAVQEIDGQALMLLKEDHLMSAIGMKLGPALKLCAKIEALRSTSGSASEQCTGKA